MIGPVARRIRLVLHQPDESAALGTEAAAGPEVPEVEFVAYAEDGRLSGRIRLNTARLSDMLNDHDEFQLESVLAEHLPGGGTMVVPELVVTRDDLVLVHMAGPRGDAARRTRTKPFSVILRAGPYLVSGDLHSAFGIDPLLYFRRRRPMVPLTDATIEFNTADGPVREFAGTIVVNRDHLEWVQQVTDRANAFDLSGLTTDAAGRRIH